MLWAAGSAARCAAAGPYFAQQLPYSLRKLPVTEKPGGRPGTVPPRLVAGALLAVLSLRILLGWGTVQSSQWALANSLLQAAAMLTLGACLWWVAKRQVGVPGASVALGLFVSAPWTAPYNSAAPGALGLFGMVYTGVGVAHALQGPRRKWPPRIALMAALTAFTAAASPAACAAGLLLASLAMVYLAQGRRRLLPPIVAVWIAAAVLTMALIRLIPGAGPGTGALPAIRAGDLVNAWHGAGLAIAMAAALALWGRSRRTRYFGNSAPLLAALLLASIAIFAGPRCLLWALPFALLFTAGCFSDGWEARRGHLWAVGYGLLCAWQFFASF